MKPDLATGVKGLVPGPVPAGPERQIGQAGGEAPAQQGEATPNQSPPGVPAETAPKTDPQSAGPSSSAPKTPPRAGVPPDSSVPGDEPPGSSNGEGAQDYPDVPTSGADPDRANDPPGEEQTPGEHTQGENGGEGTDASEDQREEPESNGPEEDSQPPGEQTSPVGDQYAPDTGGESDPETTTAE